MKLIAIASLSSLALLASCHSTQTRQAGVDMAKAMQEFTALGVPGAEHKELAKQVGTWRTTMQNRWDQNSPWETMKGTATYEPLFDGRFVVGRDKGTFEMGGQEMAFESMHFLGYDTLQQEWTSRYYSSMSTWSGALRGKKNGKGEIEYEGLHHDNMTPAGRPAKALFRWEGDDKMVFEMWDSIDNEMVLTMIWIAERVK